MTCGTPSLADICVSSHCVVSGKCRQEARQGEMCRIAFEPCVPVLLKQKTIKVLGVVCLSSHESRLFSGPGDISCNLLVSEGLWMICDCMTQPEQKKATKLDGKVFES